jgi:LmbE family N-acetylglucosaminyl deacetylase
LHKPLCLRCLETVLGSATFYCAFRTQMADFFFLSPHADDAVWSIGGLMHQLAKDGHRVCLTTLFSAQARPLTDFGMSWAERCGVDPEDLERLRLMEDVSAAECLGIEHRDAGLVDASGRPWYRQGDRIGGMQAGLHPQDDAREAVERYVGSQLQASTDAILVSAAGFGGHVDHQATAGAAIALESRLPLRLWLYEDFPYVIKLPLVEPFTALRGRDLVEVPIDVKSRRAHRRASCRYATQVRAMWESKAQFLSDFDRTFPREPTSSARVWMRGPERELFGCC